MYVKCNINALLTIIVAVEKQLALYLSVCASACVRACVGARERGYVQHATRMRHIVTSFVASSSIIFFDIIS
jgi:hypothetical protein